VILLLIRCSGSGFLPGLGLEKIGPAMVLSSS